MGQQSTRNGGGIAELKAGTRSGANRHSPLPTERPAATAANPLTAYATTVESEFGRGNSKMIEDEVTRSRQQRKKKTDKQSATQVPEACGAGCVHDSSSCCSVPCETTTRGQPGSDAEKTIPRGEELPASAKPHRLAYRTSHSIRMDKWGKLNERTHNQRVPRCCRWSRR